ncbi:MAG TPA: BLUF domain-containing protein [Phycisphaerales bacterium]|nr:BLUF domain-containing protein [Phycisphaerales bacterium]
MYQRVVYISVRPVRVSDSIVRQEIVGPSIERNAAAGVTGCLWHDSVNFLQVLEGPLEATWAVMARIRVDHRHYSVNVIADHPVSTRSFPDAPLKHVAGRASDQVGRVLTQALERAGPMVSDLVRATEKIEGIPESDRADPLRLARWRCRAPWIEPAIDELIAVRGL